jgi:DNA-binding response OmpR family regulator
MSKNQNQIKILVIADVEMVRAMVKSALNSFGYKAVEEAVDGQEAIDKILAAEEAGRPYDIIFCEWTLPVASGLEVLQFCRESSEVPFIMITAESEAAAVIKAIRAGATDYLVKPIAPEILDRKLTRIVDRITGHAA